MIFYCIGIDYKRTALAVREQAHKRRDEIIRFFRERNFEAATLFTCNRIEIYALAFDERSLRQTLSEAVWHFKDFFEKAYVHYGLAATLHHALRLTVGLCSQIRGEPQIMAQLQNWLRQEHFPPQIKRMWSLVLEQAFGIRHSSKLEQKATNIAQVVLSDLEQKLRHKQAKEILIVGTGKVAELFAKEKTGNVILHFASRKRFYKAQQLAYQSGGEALSFETIGEKIGKIDAVVSATASPHYVIKKNMILPGIGQRPLYMYDLAVPRDIEPEIAVVPRVVLRNLDDLGELLITYNQTLQPYCDNAERLITAALSRIIGGLDEYDYYSGYASLTACPEAG